MKSRFNLHPYSSAAGQPALQAIATVVWGEVMESQIHGLPREEEGAQALPGLPSPTDPPHMRHQFPSGLLSVSPARHAISA